MKTYFFTMTEYYAQSNMVGWLHECVDENIKGSPYEHFYYSDGSSSWCYKSKNYKWEISKHMDRVTFQLDEEFVPLYELKFR